MEESPWLWRIPLRLYPHRHVIVCRLTGGDRGRRGRTIGVVQPGPGPRSASLVRVQTLSTRPVGYLRHTTPRWASRVPPNALAFHRTDRTATPPETLADFRGPAKHAFLTSNTWAVSRQPKLGQASGAPSNTPAYPLADQTTSSPETLADFWGSAKHPKDGLSTRRPLRPVRTEPV